ncbi:MAG: radical SAM family heme chaperone HemW [Sphingobium sp.]
MDAPLALYIHWPFCVSKCPYCDFNSHVRETVDVEAWRAALLADMAHEATILPGRTLGSIFFGGGTPSLMPPALVAALIEAAGCHWGFADDIEITLEANPNSVEVARFADLSKAGVNRVSIGVQSFEPGPLHFLGRAHDADEARTAIEIAQREFARVSFDLIYALPDQSLDQWERQLAHALSFGTSHLSLYQLTIEPGTRFETLVRRGDFTPTDPDHAADLFELTQQATGAAGIPAYEVSNHARPTHESRHNLAYWRYHDYAGIGPGAHGRRGAMATQRHKKPENWLEAVARNGHGCQAETPLSPADQAREALMMGLRLTEGVDMAALAKRLDLPIDQMIDEAMLPRLCDMKLVEVERPFVRVSPAGLLLLDSILAELVL